MDTAFNFKSSSFSSNKLNTMETLHNTFLRNFLHADKNTPNSILYSDLVCNDIATTILARFIKFWIQGFRNKGDNKLLD